VGEDTLKFYTDRWYYLINCDGFLVGAISFCEITQLVTEHGKKKPSSSYIATFQRDPWSERESIGTLYFKKDLAAFIAGVMDEYNIKREMVADNMEISELREKVWDIFLNRFMDINIKCRTSLRARDFVCFVTSRSMKQLAAFHVVAYKEGFLDELEKWETGYHAWSQI